MHCQFKEILGALVPLNDKKGLTRLVIMIDKDIVKNGAVMTLVEKYIFIRRRAKLYLKLRSVNKKKEIAPVVSNLFITEHCNIQCNYCYSVDNSIKKSEELTTQQWLDLISELYKKGTRL